MFIIIPMDICHPFRDVPSDVGLLMKCTAHGTDIPRCYCYASRATIALDHTTAEEPPEERHKEQKASTWPQNAPDPKLTELHGKPPEHFQSIKRSWRERVCSVSSGDLWVFFFCRTLYSSHDHCHLFHSLVFLM